ncbi:MAG: ComEC/Rec2 family competence protein, partial [bacterium]|nr:ComEC/Rec2 family competence protein [bacterium]
MIVPLSFIAFMSGIGVSFFVAHLFDPFIVFVILLSLGVCLVFAWKIQPARNALLISFFFIVGIGRGILQEDFSEKKLDVSYRQEKISFTGEIIRDPLIRGGRQGLTLRVKEGNVPSSSTLFVWTSLFPTYHRWEHVEVQCGSISSGVCAYASARATQTTGTSVLRGLSESRMWLSGVIERHLPQPHAGLLGSILFGARSSLSQTLVTSFNRTGLTHIVAISGYNVALLIGVMSALFLVCGLNRKTVPFALGFSIVLFVLFTGASAATVRAGIMGYLAVIAQSIGRRVDGLHLILVSAAFMMAIHPHIISDLGFQLSFLATLGLILGSPLFESFRIPLVPRAL